MLLGECQSQRIVDLWRLTTDRRDCKIGGMSKVDVPPERLEFLQGTLDLLILRSLQIGPNHAYGISQFLENQSGHEFVVDNGTLYPSLQRLLQRGGSARSGRPRRMRAAPATTALRLLAAAS